MTNIIKKTISDFIIEMEGKWVEVWRGTEEKSALTKGKPNLNVCMRLQATPSALYHCLVTIVHQHLANLLTPCTAKHCIFQNYTKSSGLSAQPMGKGNCTPWLFRKVLSMIPHLTYPHGQYTSNSLHQATAIATMTQAKEAVIQEVMLDTHHTSASSMNAYLTDSAHDLTTVENAILACECT